MGHTTGSSRCSTMQTPELSEGAPLVIGATGGSGTRVIARIARRAGYQFGTNLNGAEDALDFLGFHDRWINPLLRAKRGKMELAPIAAQEMAQDFEKALDRYRSTMTPSLAGGPPQWGWKAPRTIYLLSLLRGRFPQMKYIHVLRDGRDMAFSRNQNQLRLHGREILSWYERWFWPKPLRAIALWARINDAAADFGEQTLGANYLRLRFEDLCSEPAQSTRRILEFLGSSLEAAPIAREEISPPRSLGRWRAQPPRLVSRLNVVACAALARFGYPTSG